MDAESVQNKMTDAQRFLRYVTPGITFGVVTLLLLWILIPDWTSPVLGAFFGKDTALAAVLATFFASGGLGYLLSVVHHCWHWALRSTDIDHSPLIRQLVEAERIVLVDIATGKTLPKGTRIDRSLAWIVLTSLWHENLGESEKLRAVNPRASGLTDLAHVSGAGRVACIAASFVALVIACSVSRLSFEPEPVIRFLVASGLAIILISMQQKNYRRACKLAQGFIEQAFGDVLLDNKQLKAACKTYHDL